MYSLGVAGHSIFLRALYIDRRLHVHRTAMLLVSNERILSSVPWRRWLELGGVVSGSLNPHEFLRAVARPNTTPDATHLKEAAVAADVLLFDNWAGTGKTREWRNAAFRPISAAPEPPMLRLPAPILPGTKTRRVRRALAAAFSGSVGKDVVSRTWRKVKGDWDAWNARSLVDELVVRLILDGTVARVRLDKKVTSVSLLVALGVRADGQKVLLTIKTLGGKSEPA